MVIAGSVRRGLAGAAMWGFAALLAADAEAACVAERLAPMAATDPALCRDLAAVIRKPSALPLADYEAKLDQFFGHYCHRDAAAGWVHDKYVRDAGPFIATLAGGAWQGKGFGTHTPVMIWYSPEMIAWLRANRPETGSKPASPPPIPDGAVMVKEMYPVPSGDCRDVEPEKLVPTNGAAIMIRENGASHDGWFWGWYGFGTGSGWSPDWPPAPSNGLQNMGFAQYCMNCHASAADNLTFASLKNVAGEPGEPLTFLSQDFYATLPPDTSSFHAQVVLPAAPDRHLGQPLHRPDDALIAALRSYAVTVADWGSVRAMPSETYDNTWVAAGGPKAADTFLTSSQCLGCHDAGSTGLQFDMTMPNPHGEGLLNQSPYATWRTSPMGLAGRDPVFFAQLASETQTFHPAIAGEVQDVCLGCHGVTGSRQFHIDEHARSGACPVFPRSMVDAVPWPSGTPDAAHANYGMLARDGVSCTACHHMIFGDKASAAAAGEPQNACIAERQALLNPDASGFARTFTGSFLVRSPDVLIGPFDKPVEAPMHAALGIKPAYDPGIKSSEICGTCHTVHLPVSADGKVIGRVYEQATYAEWAFSAYRTGATADGPLPAGAGPLAASCQDCHMPAKNADGSPSRTKIASIQEKLNFPQVEYGGAPDLPVRSPVARHVLVGLNVFLMKMAEEFPDILGIRTTDPMLVSRGVAPLLATEQAMLDQAGSQTAKVAVTDVALGADALSATVRVTSEVGHKFPSGVGFRRAFIAFSVLDQNGEVLWASGRSNAGGVIVDDRGRPIDGELWWKEDCSARLRPGEQHYQPHYRTITRQDQAQIYQELVAAPPPNATAATCSAENRPTGELTTSFLAICGKVKDNRILPSGTVPLGERIAIAKALGAGEDLAIDGGAVGVGDDPDYVSGGASTVTYRIPVADLAKGMKPAAVQAVLYYQAIPPFYLQDRFCTARGADTERLAFLAGHLNLAGTDADGWKLKVVSSGAVPVAPR
jgi:hypothetical protein